MSKIKTFLLGRHPNCHISLDDNSVSRHHAEIVPAAGDSYYITDRNSTGGTFVYKNADWKAIQQAYVQATDRLRFGRCEIPASNFEFLRGLPQGGSAKVTLADVSNTAPDNILDPNKGLAFDPDTGEVVER